MIPGIPIKYTGEGRRFAGWAIKDSEGKRASPVFDYEDDATGYFAHLHGENWYTLARNGFSIEHVYEEETGKT